MSYFWMNNYYILVIKCRRVENQARLVVYILGRIEKKWRGKEIYQGVWLGHGWICGRKIGGVRVFSPQAHQNVSPQIGELNRKKKKKKKCVAFWTIMLSYATKLAKQSLRDNFLLSFHYSFPPLFSSIWEGKKKEWVLIENFIHLVLFFLFSLQPNNKKLHFPVRFPSSIFHSLPFYSSHTQCERKR